MLSNFTNRPVYPHAYSERPFSFLTPAAQEDLSNITTIDLIENGDRAAREDWQNKQLTNLLRHTHAHSKFWRQRIPSGSINHDIVKYLPVQTREDVASQVNLEGSLLAASGVTTVTYASTGSTGTPVQVFCSPQNGYYNTVRGLTQYFINDLSLEENRVQIGPASNLSILASGPIDVKASDGWAGPLSKVFRNGSSKIITHMYDDDALVDELLKDRVGYLSCHNRYIEILLKKGGIDLIKTLGIKVWRHVSDYRDPETLALLASVGVPSLSNYSAGEVGAIAFECSKCQGYFHVTHSNVIVERDDDVTATFNDVSVGRLLVTHLHSYATPMIRYDVGDLGQVESRCPCGHDGTTISNIFGRGKHFLRHPNGKLVPFYVSTRVLLEVAAAKEYRFKQLDVDTITVEIGGRDSITSDEETKLKNYIHKATDPAFKINIMPVDEIDWAPNSKRLLFTSSVA